MKFHWPALLALLTTLTGLVTSPIVLNVVPPQWAAVIVAVGALVQSLTKALHKGDV